MRVGAAGVLIKRDGLFEERNGGVIFL